MILIQLYPLPILTHHLAKIHLNIILISIFLSSSVTRYTNIPHQNSQRTPFFLRTSNNLTPGSDTTHVREQDHSSKKHLARVCFKEIHYGFV